jgi:hypothetical protein
MPTVAYKVAPDGEKWLVMRNGEPGMSYVSQEAAYEVAAAEAAEIFGPATRSGSKSLDQLSAGPATVLVLPWTTGGPNLDGRCDRLDQNGHPGRAGRESTIKAPRREPTRGRVRGKPRTDCRAMRGPPHALLRDHRSRQHEPPRGRHCAGPRAHEKGPAQMILSWAKALRGRVPVLNSTLRAAVGPATRKPRIVSATRG